MTDFLYTNGLNFLFAKSEDVLWIYSYNINQKTYFINVGIVKYVTIKLKSGKYARIKADYNSTNDIIDYCRSVLFDAIYGYSREYEQLSLK